MNPKTFFPFPSYIDRLTLSNVMAQRLEFRPTVCSGINHLEGILQESLDHANFVCTSDICEESSYSRGGGFFKRRVFTVFIISRYEFGNNADQARKIADCRELFRQFHSRLLRDSQRLQDELIYMDTANIRSRELGGVFLNGCTGLYFMVTVDEPMDIRYNADEWTE